jgi:hypothetical protein
VTWPPGATTPDPAAIAALTQLPAGLGVVVELNVTPLPVDDAGRAALAQYATALAQQVPRLRYLVLGPAATTATAATYAAALDTLRPAVQAAVPGALVGLSLDGSANTKGTITALAAASADVVAFRPAPAAGKGLWTFANLPQLSTALTAAYGVAPPVLVDGLAAPIAPSIAAAACMPGLAGVVLDRLSDTTPAAAAAAISAAQRGATVCPGLATQVTPSTLVYPTALANPVGVQLACDRDCLYLVTLDGPNGLPVVARRGALRASTTPARITLPNAKLASGNYTVSVQLIAQVNPGAVTKLESPPLVAG